MFSCMIGGRDTATVKGGNSWWSEISLLRKKEVCKVLWGTFFFFCFAVLYKCCVFWNDKDVSVCVCARVCVYMRAFGLCEWAGAYTHAEAHVHARAHTHVHRIRGRAALTPASLWSVSPGLPARAALHRTTHADTMLTSDSPQLSDRDKPGETPNCATALPLASADASFKNGMNYF